MEIEKFKKTILLVEDEAIISIVTSKAIQSFGYEVITANTGEKGIAAAAGNSSINLIIMDIDLGSGIDGTEAARQILSSVNIPIIFHTSHSERDMVEKVRGITRYGYVIKSSGNFVLQSSIEMAFELFEAHTNLKDTIKSLQKSEERYAIINNSSLDVIFSQDCEGRFTSVNKKFCTLLNLNAGQIIGKTRSELGFPEELCRDFDTFHKQVYETESTITSHFSVTLPDGEVNFFEITLNPLYDNDSNIIGIGGTSRNVTDKKRAQDELKVKNEELEALNEQCNGTIEEMDAANEELAQMNDVLIKTENVRMESEERYRLLFHHSPLGLIHFDTNGVIRKCNDTIIRITGSSHEKLMALNLMNLPDAKLISAIQNALNGEVSFYEDIYKSITSDKSTAVKVVIAPVKNLKNEILGGIIIAEDNSAWLKVEDALNKKKESFRQMFYQHKSVMLLIEPDTGQIIDANSSAENFYGYTAEEMRQMRIEDINTLPQEDVANERLRAITEERNYFIFPHVISNGKIRTVEVYSSPVVIDGFEKPLLFSIIHDITRLKESTNTLNNGYKSTGYIYSNECLQ